MFTQGRIAVFTGLLVLSTVFSGLALARPEYAVRSGINRCTACHYSPAGGGPRNLEGKYFGSAGYKLSPFSAQKFAGAEVKFLYYSPEKRTEVRNGLAAMMGSVWAAIPLMEDEKATTRLVGEQNIGGFSAAGPRHLYLQIAANDGLRESWLPQHIQFGRMIPPFGIMTDEHRTYVRLQSASAWNQNVAIGALLAANPYDSLHYDIAVLNGGPLTDGSRLTTGQASQWGYLGNIRFQPSKGGFMLGLSALHYDADVGAGKTSRAAQSAYGVFSIQRWTGGRVPATVLAEYAEAVNMNGTFTNTFVSDVTAYGPSVASTRSRGILGQLNYDLTPKVQLQYKFDWLVLDSNFPADAYDRHGFGVKHYFGPNMWFQMRYERATSSRPGEEAGTGAGAIDAFWTVVNAAL